MNKDYEVTSSNYSYNMANWCTEKSRNVVKQLANIVQLLENSAEIPNEIKENIEFYLAPALYDATKMLSFSCGAEWTTDDRDLIMKKGKAGYDELIKIYKCK